jgi:cobalt/nickel transport system permease protein
VSHLHIPDGVLPLWLVGVGWAITATLLGACVVRLRGSEQQRRVPQLGVMAALMLVGMTVELAPIGYHLNLSVMAGIVLGPTLGFIAAFVVDVILALLGHGGITVVGLNTLIVGAEVALGWLLFRAGWALLRGRAGVGLTAGLATILSLALSTVLMIGVVGIAGGSQAMHPPEAGAVEPGTLALRNPFSGGLLAWELLAPPEPSDEEPATDLRTFAALALGLGAIGWAIEGAVTGLVARYVGRIRPDLLDASQPEPLAAAAGA